MVSVFYRNNHRSIYFFSFTVLKIIDQSSEPRVSLRQNSDEPESPEMIMDSGLMDSDGDSGDNDSSSDESSEETFDMV